MTKIYYNTKSNQKDEQNFINKLANEISNTILVKENYKLPQELIHCELNVREIEPLVSDSKKLNSNKKNKLLIAFEKLPDFIKVAKSISEVSVDVVIVTDSILRLLEFHEKQHRNLSVGRLMPIFSSSSDPIRIPRYAQRFLKDIWRSKYLNNFQIVWWDWFYLNNRDSIKIILDNPNKQEFCLDGQFNFSEFKGN